MTDDAAKKAEVSDFEKSEVKKALDEIVNKAMGEKSTPAVEKIVTESAPVAAKKAVVKKTSAVVERAVAEKVNAIKRADAAREVVKKPVGKRMDFAKKPANGRAVAKKTATKKPVVKPKVTRKVASEPAPLVSIILPVHNAARYVDSTIHSVLGQTFLDFELIIVDDCSEDGTLRVVREFSSDKIKTVALTQKGGMAKARNVGVEKASGRYICFLSARDMWQPDKLERQLEFMQDNGAAFSYTGYVYSDENGIPSGKAVRVPAEISGLQAASRASSILVSTVMLDMSKLAKDDIRMPVSVRNSKTATWQKILKKTSRAYGLNEVLVIRGYDYKAPLWKRVWRRV